MEVFKNYSECYFIEKNDGNTVQSIQSGKQVHFKCSISSKSFKLPFDIVLWKIMDKISKISINTEKLDQKIQFNLPHK